MVTKKPGAAPVKTKEKRRWGASNNQDASAIASGIEAKLWQDAIMWVLAEGHGLVITRTKDDTAVHLTLLSAGLKEKRICPNAESLREALEALEDV